MAYNKYQDSKTIRPVVEGGPFSLANTTLSLSIEQDVCPQEPLASYSIRPGAFVCNYLYYTALYHLDIKTIFIHLPEKSKLSFERQKTAVEIARDSLMRDG